MTVARKDDFQWDALATHQTGEIILSGKTSLGFTGFESHDGTSTLSFGFPYREAPKTYIRKLTLAPEVTSFQYLKKRRNSTPDLGIYRGAGYRLLRFYLPYLGILL